MTIGIYCIENLIDGKKYIGKSVNVHERLTEHKRLLTKEVCTNQCNRYLFAAVKKYGIENFHFGLVEEVFVRDHVLLSERELYWQDWYNAHNREYGYNSVRESAGRITYSDHSKKLMAKAKIGKKQSKEHIAARMAGKIGVKRPDYVGAKISKTKTGLHVYQYSYEQYSMSGEFIKLFSTRKDLVVEGFRPNAVSAVCNGGGVRNKSHRGFIWKKVLNRQIVVDEKL